MTENINVELLIKLAKADATKDYITRYINFVSSPVSYNDDKDTICNIVKIGLQLFEDRLKIVRDGDINIRKDCAIDISSKIFNILYANQGFMKNHIKFYFTVVAKLQELVKEADGENIKIIMNQYLEKFKNIAINDAKFLKRLTWENKHCYKYNDVMQLFSRYNLRKKRQINYKKFF